MPALEVVALIGRDSQENFRARRRGGGKCRDGSALAGEDCDAVGLTGHVGLVGGIAGVLPKYLDFRIGSYGVKRALAIFCTVNFPSIELLALGRGESAGGKTAAAALCDGQGLHNAVAAVCVKGDGEPLGLGRVGELAVRPLGVEPNVFVHGVVREVPVLSAFGEPAEERRVLLRGVWRLCGLPAGDDPCLLLDLAAAV